MRFSFNGVEWGDVCYFYWFDPIEVPENKLFGYERIYDTHMLCFWWFCVTWKLR
jgi:hypothetical protein